MRSIFAALSLVALFACASSNPEMRGSGGDVQSCGTLSPAVVEGGATIYTRPDNTSAAVLSVDKDTSVCAGSDLVGFYFHRVKLSDGREGFVKETQLELH